MDTPKGYGAPAVIDSPAAVFKKPSEK